ncbi:hypothetical protein QVM48_27965 [Pseudomonas soli]|jgi:hypothetical protein|uniref:hypothetical protein n=1 Tax=Pseudomonas soli TaxID=1306993 RepID=UPI002893ABFB|nr:hypothetical protein [Pseudomonas soli]EKT4503711.1 hypothetical protein [Pseudomonas putida]MDT3717819.1 hypothetical protein [Pseudomonas soli]MDT3734544.1 hypothetical protein [Pseudomonas soli]
MEIRHYPKNPPSVGSIILTSYGAFAHENEVPKSRAADAIRIGKEIAGQYETDEDHLIALMLLLSDIPVDPLLKASAAQKGSVLGLAALGYLLSRHSSGQAVRQALTHGGGIFLVNLTGDQEAPSVEVEVFKSWREYQDHLEPILSSGNFTAQKPSSFS